MKLHIGKPKHPGIIRFQTDSINGTANGKPWHQERFVVHTIKSWLGISLGSRWYFGLIRFSRTDTEVKNS